MLTSIAIFFGGQTLATLISSLIGLIFVRKRQQVLQQILASQQGEARAFEAYLRYVAARTRLLGGVRNANTYIVLLPLSLSLGFIIVTSINLWDSAIFGAFLLLPLLLAMIIGIVLGSVVQGFVGSITSDAEALRLFRINNLQRRAILIQKVRRILIITLPSLLYLEVLGYIVLFVNASYIPFLVLQVFALLILVLRTVFAAPIRAWTTSVCSIGDTEWLHLLPRITAWARIAGIEFAAVLVQQDQIGDTNVRVVGSKRPILILSESFLRYSDWRQQDAAIGIAIGVIRKRILRSAMLYSIFVIATCIIFLFTLYITNTLNASHASELYSIAFVVLLFFFVIRLCQQYSRRFLRAKYFVVDRIAAYLTGDPVAVIVALNTFSTLNGVIPDMRSASVPSINDRIRMLDALVRTPWPRASFAAVPIPSIARVTIGSYLLTSPFSPNRDVSPVPETAYVQLPK